LYGPESLEFGPNWPSVRRESGEISKCQIAIGEIEMAKPGSTSAGALTGLVISAAVFAVTLFLNQSQSPSSLVMPMAEQGDFNSDATATTTVAR